jgi:hypothetical protein
MIAVDAGSIAAFCNSDLRAFGALVVAQLRGMPVSVPKRLAVCNFGDPELRAANWPFITIDAAAGRALAGGGSAPARLGASRDTRPGARRAFRIVECPFF